ncbi:MAG: radical SAM protein [bacterium]|nr:radical SAM protein [bacterium]
MTTGNHPQISDEIDLKASIPFKLSMFAHVAEGNILWNDLNDHSQKIAEPMIPVLRSFREKPQTIAQFLKETKNKTVESRLKEFIADGILVPADRDETALFYPHRVEIETVTHCNAGCVYCPQGTYGKKPAVMSPEVFETVISRLKPYRVNWTALNHYGEPLLDPHFKKRVELLTANGHSLLLFTNATLMTGDIIRFFKGQRLEDLR